MCLFYFKRLFDKTSKRKTGPKSSRNEVMKDKYNISHYDDDHEMFLICGICDKKIKLRSPFNNEC